MGEGGAARAKARAKLLPSTFGKAQVAVKLRTWERAVDVTLAVAVTVNVAVAVAVTVNVTSIEIAFAFKFNWIALFQDGHGEVVVICLPTPAAAEKEEEEKEKEEEKCAAVAGKTAGGAAGEQKVKWISVWSSSDSLIC